MSPAQQALLTDAYRNAIGASLPTGGLVMLAAFFFVFRLAMAKRHTAEA